MKRPILIAAVTIAMPFAAATKALAEPPRLAMSLAEAGTAALSYSPRLKAAAEQIAASRDRADSLHALLIPRLTLDGSYRYATEIPNVQLPKGFPPLPLNFGSHRTTSIGPTLTYTLWDQGVLDKGWRSQLATVRSQEDAEALARNQILLGVRLAYFQVQLSLEQVTVLGDSMNLADSQYSDIHKQLSAGAASRVDALSAHQQLLNRRKDFRQAQADVASSLRELFALTGSTSTYDLSHPMDARAARSTPAYAGTPTLLLALDPLVAPSSSLSASASRDFDAEHPELRGYTDQAQALRLTSQSLAAGQGPKIQLSGRASYDYPNIPLLETVQQNTLTLTASVPLFEASKSKRQADEQNHIAAATDSARQQSFDELKKDWLDARDQFDALQDQQALDQDSVSETGEISRLKYGMYKAGSITFTEVQSANLDALQAKVAAARTQAQLLIRLATLDSLSVHP